MNTDHGVHRTNETPVVPLFANVVAALLDDLLLEFDRKEVFNAGLGYLDLGLDGRLRNPLAVGRTHRNAEKVVFGQLRRTYHEALVLVVEDV